MTINTINDLKKVIQLCKKEGVTAIKIDGIELTITPKQTKTKKSSIDLSDFPEANLKVPQYVLTEEQSALEDIKTPDMLTEEQLLFYSSDAQNQQEQ